MNAYLFTLTTQSMLLTGSGEGGEMIDTDVVFHRTGFPMIPSRRIKGLLRESLMESLEMANEPNDKIRTMCTALFGTSGGQTITGKLLIPNLFLHKWADITALLENSNQLPEALSPQWVRHFFTTEIQQTAIDGDGIAKKHSLRTYRVIKPGFKFEAVIQLTKPLTEDEIIFLKKAVANLRHAGTRRNRGFGKIKCTIESVQPEPNTAGAKNEVSTATELSVTLKTQSPVVLALQQGDQNTVFSQKFVPGNQVRGLLANAFMQIKSLKAENAHRDPDFADLFLFNKVVFGNLSLTGSRPIPLHIQTFKQDPAAAPVSVFTQPVTNASTRSVGGYGNWEAGVVIRKSPHSTFYFHNSRPNRTAGRNRDDDNGGIFYYEALDENQHFQGKIIGPPELLKKLSTTLPAIFNARAGRSRSAQYGEVLMTITPGSAQEEVQHYPAGKYVLTLNSALILYNENGMAIPDTYTLIQHLTTALEMKPGQIELLRAVAPITQIEQFNSIWQSKSGKLAAYREGGSFLIQLTADSNRGSRLAFLGELNDRGFGSVDWMPLQEDITFRWPGIVILQSNQVESGQAAVTASELQQQPNSVFYIEQIKASFRKTNNAFKAANKAIVNVQKSGPIELNNHLISRMERLFDQETDENIIKEWINNTRGKPAGMALKKAGIINDDYVFNYKKVDETDNSLNRIYWVTFFQFLRKLNKANGK